MKNEKGKCRINVMMVGGRRCGKTSVIAAMKDSFQKVLGGSSDLLVVPDSTETKKKLYEKSLEIADYFARDMAAPFTPDNNPDEAIVHYKFEFRLKGKKESSVFLDICDYPGEWLNPSHPEYEAHEPELKEVMKKSNIVIIAIDTVALMEKAASRSSEDVGRFNPHINFCSSITDMIIADFDAEENGSPKMIIFVPLKCEKYWNRSKTSQDDQMSLVNARIHTAYKGIFDFVGGSNKGRYEIVIAPILTFGENTAEFARYEDKDGEIILDEKYKLPTAKYTFVNKSARYSPMYCEQPLLYILAYLLEEMRKLKQAQKDKANFLKLFFMYLGEKYGDISSAEDFLEQRDKIKCTLKISGDGYEVTEDPLGFRGG